VTEEVKHEEQKPTESKIMKTGLIDRYMKWLKGGSKKEYVENISYSVILFSAFLVFVGMLVGSFSGTFVAFAILGAFLFLVGVIVFIYSNFLK